MSNTPYELFHVECGKGWASLYEPILQRCTDEGVDIMQVKEKFGGLRIYVANASGELYDAIDAAEDRSFEICEECGEPGRLRGGGRLRTLCDKHSDGRPDTTK